MPGRTSPLFRRIARHTRLATIFRQPQASFSPAAGFSPVDQHASSLPVQPVKARLLPAGSRLPEAILLPRLPGMERMEAIQEPAAAAERTSLEGQPAIQTAPAPAAPARPEPPSSAGAELPARPLAPPAAQVTGPADEDRNWRRLQTIFQRHHEKELTESAAKDLPEPDISAAPDILAGPDVLTGPDERSRPAGAPGEQPAPSPAQPGEATPTTDRRPYTPGPQWPSMDTSSRRVEPREAAPSGPIQRQAAGLPASPTGPQPPASAQPAPGGREPMAAQTSTGQPALEDEVADAHPTQSLPLEAVWPVQRTPAPAPGAEVASRRQDRPEEQAESTALSQARTESARQAETGPEVEPEDTLEQRPASPDQGLAHLQQARSGQPSASTIEVIPPRRPHPLRKPQSSPDHPTSPVDTRPEEAGTAADFPKEGAARIQKQTEPGQSPAPFRPALDQAAPPRQVPTEIGPLPEDLWRLLGEEPPAAEDDTAPLAPARPSQQAPAAPSLRPPETRGSSAPDFQPGTAGVARSGPVAIQRAIAAAESHPGPKHPAGLDVPAQDRPAPAPATGKTPLQDVLPPIQHLQTALNIPEIGASTAEKPGQNQETELDLDELARQVYGQVRRKLEIEFERQHRRI